MIQLHSDQRIILTLDAGGTNFVFSAIQAGKEITEPLTFPSQGNNLEICLKTIRNGFKELIKKLPTKPAAISFAFPGPADYPAGIIGDLGNLPAFRGGVPLGPMLSEEFGIPVFINNDGDLFAYGEAIAGFLPEINKKLRDSGSSRQFNNLLGITLGTGIGAGIVRNNELFLGDNAASAEIWLVRHCNLDSFAEEGASIRAIQREYHKVAGLSTQNILSPKEIYEIAMGKREGNKSAALQAFQTMAEVAGDALANAITLVDGLIVLGGGLTGSHPLFLDSMVKAMNRPFKSLDGKSVNRLEFSVFNLENEEDFKIFAEGKEKLIPVPGTDKSVLYDEMKRTGVGISRLGASKAVAIGAYAFALFKLDH